MTGASWESRVLVDASVCGGRPVVRGTKIAVRSVLERLGAGGSIESILKEHATLSRDYVLACLRFASEVLARRSVVVSS